MWSKSRFTLCQIDWCIRVRGLHLSKGAIFVLMHYVLISVWFCQQIKKKIISENFFPLFVVVSCFSGTKTKQVAGHAQEE